MSAEKRSVHTDALETLGRIITSGKRDAIHIAVEPCIAGELLLPGSHIRIKDGMAYTSSLTGPITEAFDKPLGIVDPFLTVPVEFGEMFWLLVYPRKITSLRHVWEHPDFPETPHADELAPKIEASKKVQDRLDGSGSEWIREFAESKGLDYLEIMAAANDYISSGEYLNKGDLLDGESVPDEFWDHFEKVTGQVILNRGNFFSCSC